MSWLQYLQQLLHDSCAKACSRAHTLIHTHTHGGLNDYYKPWWFTVAFGSSIPRHDLAHFKPAFHSLPLELRSSFFFPLQFWISSFSDGRIQLASSCTSGVSTLREMWEPYPHASRVGCSPLIWLIGMKCGWHCWFSWSHTGYFYICVGVVQPHKSSCLYVMSFELWMNLTGEEKKWFTWL